MFVTMPWCRRWKISFSEHCHGRANDTKRKCKSKVDAERSVPSVRPHVPCLAVFSKIGLVDAEGFSICATAFPMRENIGGAVTELPIAHGSFGNIYQECYTSSENTDKGSSYPSLAGIKVGD